MTLVLSAALINFAVGVVGLTRACSDLSCDVTAGVAGSVLWGIAAGAAVLAVGVAARRRREFKPFSRAFLAVVASVAFSAATPTEAAWFADCNTHNAWGSFAGGVVAAVADSGDPRLTFTHGQTLQGCV